MQPMPKAVKDKRVVFWRNLGHLIPVCRWTFLTVFPSPWNEIHVILHYSRLSFKLYSSDFFLMHSWAGLELITSAVMSSCFKLSPFSCHLMIAAFAPLFVSKESRAKVPFPLQDLSMTLSNNTNTILGAPLSAAKQMPQSSVMENWREGFFRKSWTQSQHGKTWPFQSVCFATKVWYSKQLHSSWRWEIFVG